ncbi:hypothetical protein, conserved [Plasmodium ovale curtisi]|uniref:Uncharacterized protein n=1 Tax=Plasmodium ovale curtisi TaxID=864141 RepID=A0A1A8WX68_PLAOA|nr:hypothetical protein, conserved [Plasmodium ovale curtisi]
MFTIIKNMHTKKKKKKKKINPFLNSLIRKENSAQLTKSEHNENQCENFSVKNCYTINHLNKYNKEGDENIIPLSSCPFKRANFPLQTGNSNKRGNVRPDNGQNDNIQCEHKSGSERDNSDNDQNANYKNSFNINKEENYFKKFYIDPEKKKKKIPYSDTNFSSDIKRTYKKRYKIIFNKKLFNLFEKCEELFNKGLWLLTIFNSNLNEKKIFNLINTILESEEKEILIKPKYEKYFYSFVKNMCINESTKGGRNRDRGRGVIGGRSRIGGDSDSSSCEKKLSSGSSTFHRINRSMSSKSLQKSLKGNNTKHVMTNNPYHNLGISVKVKKKESSSPSQTSDQSNTLNKDKLSLLLKANNKEQNFQECIIDYIDYAFGDPRYCNPARMYCTINQIDTTVSFVKMAPIL